MKQLTQFLNCEDLKATIKAINERFARENCDSYISRIQYNEARRKYLKFMLGQYNPQRTKWQK